MIGQDLQSKFLIVLKGGLFAVLCIGAGVGAVLDTRPWAETLMVAIAVWSGARFYYFLFYVLENYVDPSLKYAGIWAMISQLWQKK